MVMALGFTRDQSLKALKETVIILLTNFSPCTVFGCRETVLKELQTGCSATLGKLNLVWTHLHRGHSIEMA